MVQETELDNVEAYLKLIKQYKKSYCSENFHSFLFRGQSGDYPLMPKLCRLKSRGSLLDTEKKLLQEFKRTNPLLIEQHRPLDDWDYLTLGQHFGLPTRFLDWTNNALTALWFATRPGESENGYSIVWILVAEESDFMMALEAIHPFDIDQTQLIMPRIIKQRINNQSGVFSITSSNELLAGLKMDESDYYQKKLIKVKVPTGKHNEIRQDLNTLGINAFSVFPELEGLCAYLQWRYFE